MVVSGIVEQFFHRFLVSPTFSDGEDECRAGTPFVAPRPGPHSRHCFFIPEGRYYL